jgi:hypothetical protein
MLIRNLPQLNQWLVIATVALISCYGKTWKADSIGSMLPRIRDVTGHASVIYATKFSTNKDIDEERTGNSSHTQRYISERKQVRYLKDRTSDDNVNHTVNKVGNEIEAKYEGLSPNSVIDANLTFNATSSRFLSSSWIDRVTSRIISAFTLLAISQSIIHILKADKNEIASEVSHLF